MKGFVEIELKDSKTGEVVKKIKDHNLVTNFFKEYFRELGPTKGLPTDYDITNMLGGLLLFKDQIQDADADTVLLPPGNQMVANGCYGVINGVGNAVTEMGSWDSSESGWIDSYTFKQTYEWASSQGIGTINCVCLTSRGWGFIGEGNATSKRAKDNSNYRADYMTGLGTNYYKNLTAYNLARTSSKDKNYVYTLPDSLLNGSGDYALNTYQKIRLYKNYMPIDTVDFRESSPQNRVYLADTVELNVTIDNPNIQLTSNLPITDEDGTHFCFMRRYNNRCGTTQSANIGLLCIDITENDQTGDLSLSQQTVAIPDAVYSEMKSNYKYYSGDNYGYYTAYSNADYAIILPADNQYGGSSLYAYIIERESGDWHKIPFPVNTQDAHYYAKYSVGYVDSQYAYIYYKDMLYIACNYTGTSGWTVLFKVDFEAKTLTRLNQSTTGAGNYMSSLYKFPHLLHPLCGACIGSSGNSRYGRHAKYLATIYNLSEPLVKTGDMTMRVTYTITFNNEPEEEEEEES